MTPITPLSGGNLASIRADGNFSRIYLALYNPDIVFACQINQAIIASDMLAQFNYDNPVRGLFGDVATNMTVLFGAAVGDSSLGVARVRKGWTSAIAYIGEESELALADNIFATVVNDYGLWARHIKINGGAAYMDYDVAYVDQNLYHSPIPVMGEDAVIWLDGVSPAAISFDATRAWCPGSTISAYSWSVSAGAAISGAATATPVFTISAAGTYIVALTVTADNGKNATGHRLIYAFSDASPALSKFTIDNLSGAPETGWQFSVTTNDADSISAIRAGARAVLFARDSYGIIGLYPGRGNILASGNVSGETITVAPDSISVSFSAQSAAEMLKTMEAYPSGLRQVAGTPASWTEMQSLTVDKFLAHFATWRTTLASVTDILPTGDTRLASELAAGGASIYDQVNSNLRETILARLTCNRANQLAAQKPYNLMTAAERAAIVNAMAISDADIVGDAGVERRTRTEISQINLSGVAVDAGSLARSSYSMSPGHVFARFGAAKTYDRLLLTDQAQANQTAGLLAGSENNLTPSIALTLSELNHALDVSPAMTVSLGLADYTGLATITGIQHDYDADTGMFLTKLTLQGVTSEWLSTNGDIPDADFPIDNPIAPPPPEPPIVIPPVFVPGLYPMYVLVWAKTGIFWTIRAELELPSPTWHALVGVGNDALWPLLNYDLSHRHWDIGKYGSGNDLWIHNGATIWHGTVEAGVVPLFGYPFFSSITPSGETGTRYCEDIYAHPFNGRIIGGIRAAAGSPVYGSKYFIRGDKSGLELAAHNNYLSTSFHNGGYVQSASGNAILTSFYAGEQRTIKSDDEMETASLAGGWLILPACGAHAQQGLVSSAYFTDSGYGSTCVRSDDSLVTFTVISAPGLDFADYNRIPLFAYTDDGMAIMYYGFLSDSDHANFAIHYSADGGSTWITRALPAGYYADNIFRGLVYNCGDAQTWTLIERRPPNVGGTRIWFTLDSGATWIDKSGDYHTVSGEGEMDSNSQPYSARLVIM